MKIIQTIKNAKSITTTYRNEEPQQQCILPLIHGKIQHVYYHNLRKNSQSLELLSETKTSLDSVSNLPL